MNAPLGNNSSYVWRSLLWGRKLLDSGLYWRVGTGKNIKIYNDRWQPDRQSLISCHNQTATDLYVCSLLTNGNWNVDTVRETFESYISDQILDIPLLPIATEDNRFWRHNIKGNYAVRDGYRAVCGFYSPPAHQSELMIRKWWKFIWSLAIPPKIRIFWWRLSHDILSTAANLKRHHIPCMESCLFCGFHRDSSIHTLYLCPVMRKFWKRTDLWHVISQTRDLDTLDFCQRLQFQLDREQFERIATFTWGLWSMRMEVTHNETSQILERGMDWCMSFLNDFRAATYTLKLHDQNNQQHSASVWEAPSPGTLQLEVDVCVNNKHRKFGIGCVFRDHNGKKIFGFGNCIKEPQSVMDDELQAIQEGLSFAQARGLRRFRVVSDSLTSVQAVMKWEEDLNYTGARIILIRKLMEATQVIDIRHVRRNANIVAHNIARFASSSPSPLVWEIETFPLWMEYDVI